MKFILKHKGKITVVVLLLAVLIFTMFSGQKKAEDTVLPDEQETISENATTSLKSTKEPEKKEVKPSLAPEKTTEPVSTPVPEITATQVPEEAETVNLCTIEIRCDTILNNMDAVAPEKRGIIPQNGVILAGSTVEFSDGETVFDILLRETKKNKIHLEFEGTTVYDSVYIEGIANIYEFDAGDLSGWLYRVNGKIPSVGCSLYKPENGDKIEFVYSCNMGMDL